MDLERELRALAGRVAGDAGVRARSSSRRRRRWPLGGRDRASRRSPPRSPCRSRAARSSASSTSARDDPVSSTRCRPRRSGRSAPASARRVARRRRHATVLPLLLPPLATAADALSTRRGDLARLRRPRQAGPPERGRAATASSSRSSPAGQHRRSMRAGPGSVRTASGSRASTHVFFFPREPARLAGNTLVWQGNGTHVPPRGPGLSEAGSA